MCSRPSFLPPLLHINNCSCCKPWFSLWEGSCTRWPEQLALSNGSTLYGFLFQKTHILKDSCIFFHVVDVYWSVESRNSYSTVMLMSMWACGCSQRLCRVYQLKWQVTTTLGEASNSKCCFPADSPRLCWAMVEEAGAERWAALDSSANRVVRAGRKSIWRITAGWGEVGGSPEVAESGPYGQWELCSSALCSSWLWFWIGELISECPSVVFLAIFLLCINRKTM